MRQQLVSFCVGLLLAVAAFPANQATVTPGVWNAYQGSSIVSPNHPTQTACVDALKARGPGLYGCRTTSRVVVIEVADAGMATVSWDPPKDCTDGTALTNCEPVAYRIVYGRDPNQLAQAVQLPATARSHVFTGLASGTWYFAGIAVSATRESNPSGSVNKAVS